MVLLVHLIPASFRVAVRAAWSTAMSSIVTASLVPMPLAPASYARSTGLAAEPLSLLPKT